MNNPAIKTLALIGTGFGINFDQQKMVKIIHEFVQPDLTIYNSDDFNFLGNINRIRRDNISSASVIIICPKLGRKIKRDDNFWKLVEQIRDTDKSIVIIWATNYLLTYQNADEIQKYMDKTITITKPYLNKSDLPGLQDLFGYNVKIQGSQND